MTDPIPFQLRLPPPAGVPHHERTLRGRLRLPEPGDGAPPVVVLVPGYLASMDWGFLPWIAAELAERGIASLALTLSGSGFAEDPSQVTERIAFEHNTYAQELEDLGHAADWLAGRREVDLNRRGILGHSRGSAMALLHAAGRGGYRALCTWATVARVGRYDPDRVELWRREGRLPVHTAGGQRFELAPNLLQDFTENAYDLEQAARTFGGRALLVHGLRDRSVPPEEAREVAARFQGRAELVEVPATGHNFGARHPVAQPGEALRAALGATADFFEREL